MCENRDNRFFCSKYLAGEQGLSLPNGISVVRPLLDKNSDEIEEELKNKKKFVKRNYSTGDKYFDYSREGCCLQFCDPGTKITTDIADKLYLYNDIANNWGRNHKIRTSVHLPSTFVVTIPCGYEDNVISDLREHGLFVDFDCNSPLQKNNYLSIAIEHYPDKSFSADIFLFLMRRFSERLGIKEDSQSSAKIFCAKNDNITLSAHFLCNALVLSIQYQSHDKITFCNRLYHLCIEVFHTRAISINGKSIDRGDVLRDPLFI